MRALWALYGRVYIRSMEKLNRRRSNALPVWDKVLQAAVLEHEPIFGRDLQFPSQHLNPQSLEPYALNLTTNPLNSNAGYGPASSTGRRPSTHPCPKPCKTRYGVSTNCGPKGIHVEYVGSAGSLQQDYPR